MSITKCLSRKNSRALIKYLLDGKAHDQTVTQFRNLAVSGHNLMTTKGIFNQQIVDQTYLWPFVANQFQATQQMSYAASKGRKKSIEAYHMIFSFSNAEFPLNGNQTKEAQQVVKLVGGYLNQRLPKDSQWIMAVQRDGRGHKLHAHVALNSVQTTGKTIQKQYVSWRDLVYQKDGQPVRQQGLASTFDDYLIKNFEKVTQRSYAPVKASRVNRVHGSEEQIIARGGYDWHLDLKNRITAAVKDPNVHSLSDFEAACAKQGVTVIRKRRGTGKKHEDGTKIYRVGYTYEFVGKDIYKSGKRKGQPHVHKMRDYRMDDSGHPIGKGSLGTAFTPIMIAKEISEHELIAQESNRRLKQAGLSESVSPVGHDEAGSPEQVATDQSAIQSRDKKESEDDEPRIHTAGEESKSTAEPEPDSSYSSSRNRQTFTAPRHLKYVDYSVFDPDADSDRRHRKAAEERAKRNAEFKRRAQAIAEYNRSIDGNTQRIQSNNSYSRQRIRSAFAKLWDSLLHFDILAEIKRIFGLNAQPERLGQVHPEPNGSSRNTTERTKADSQHTIDDGPDLF